jgi:hypothetical protein
VAKISNLKKFKKKLNILATCLIIHVANWQCGNKPRGQLTTWPIKHVTKI